MSFIVKTYAVGTPKREEGKRPLSILMIGDLHGKAHGRKNRDLMEAVRKMRPDLAVTVGDMVMCVPDFDISDLLEFYAELRKICPVFAVNGNHETKMRQYTVTYGTIYKEYDHELQREGVVMLNNRSVTTSFDGLAVRMTGFEADLARYKRFRPHRLRTGDLIETIGPCSKDPAVFNILLAHTPLFAKTYFSWGADLILSGHYHGGLVRIGDQPVASPYGRLFPRNGYGMRRNDDQTMIITSGAGDHEIPLRIGNPHEIVQIILDHKEEEAADGDCGTAPEI